MKYSLHNTIDNRYYKHGIQVLGSMLDFHDVRVWLTKTYGIGHNLDTDEPVSNEFWGFYVKFQHHMVYLKSETELNWFKLKYGTES